jgi:uroporphyrin-III C-methyltransferase
MNIMPTLPTAFPAFPEFKPGEVWLVGAGPGDPRLLTLMAVHALRSADIVVHDALIDMRVLELVAPGASILSAGKRGGTPSPHQADINEQVIALAQQGRKVVRLKGGDPFVFGRGGEEALALARAGVPFRVVPGLTAGLSAAALAGIPATSRATNHAVILATGHRAVDDRAAREWEALARTGQPIVLYMSMSNLGEIAAAFLRAGMSPDTPATVIASATYPGERILETRIDTAAADAKAHGIGAPAIVVIGSIAGLRVELVASLIGGAA